MIHEDPSDTLDYPLEATVKLERNTYERLKTVVKRKEKDVKNTVNCLVKKYVSRECLFERYRPFLFIVTVQDSSLFIKDEKVNKLLEVILKYKDNKSNEIMIYCNECETDYCPHTAFTLASSELGLLQVKTRK